MIKYSVISYRPDAEKDTEPLVLFTTKDKTKAEAEVESRNERAEERGLPVRYRVREDHYEPRNRKW